MSRIGRKPVAVPKGVEVTVADGQLVVKGPKGTISRKVAPGIRFEHGDGEIVVQRGGDRPSERAYHGLMRALLANMVEGVTKGFERRLEIVGVGYKAEVKGNEVVFHLGYSHPIRYPFPEGVSIAVQKDGKVIVSGIDKERVGQAAAEIRAFRPPDSYKGKGIRYENERIRLKAGKSAQ